jgi:hypothetical protein
MKHTQAKQHTFMSHKIRLKDRQRDRRQKCLAAEIYKNVTDVIGVGNEF